MPFTTLDFTNVNVKLRKRGSIEPEGAAVWEEVGPAVFPVVKPINDLLGLRDERTYLAWLERDWQRWARRRTARKWVQEDVPTRFVEAARRATEGRFPYAEMADLLGRLRFAPGQLDAPDLPTLAAWALQEATQRGYRARKCEECGYLWLSSRDPARYCYRPARGGLTTCAQLHAHERFAGRRDRWNKEYRRIYARKLRGTVSDEEWGAWRAEATSQAPEFFVPFDLWKQLCEAQRLNERTKAAQVMKLIREWTTAWQETKGGKDDG